MNEERSNVTGRMCKNSKVNTFKKCRRINFTADEILKEDNVISKLVISNILEIHIMKYLPGILGNNHEEDGRY